MKKQRFYIDTSVIGGCYDIEFSRWSNGLIKDFKNNIFTPVLSEVVESEILQAPDFVIEKYKELLLLEYEFIKIRKDSLDLSAKYISSNILSERYSKDALHIALATIAEVDLLISWNFKHIVRYDKIRGFNSINIANGYKSLSIYSPREVTLYGKEND